MLLSDIVFQKTKARVAALQAEINALQEKLGYLP
jgi:hypothetical protein